jgi:acyl carrier protein
MRSLIADHFHIPVDSVQLTSSLVYDLGADSSDVLDLCVQLSDKYDCELDSTELAGIRTVVDLCKLVERACELKQSAKPLVSQ